MPVSGVLPELEPLPLVPLLVSPVVPAPELPLVAAPVSDAEPVSPEPDMLPVEPLVSEPLMLPDEPPMPELEPGEPVPPIDWPASIFTATFLPWRSL